MRGSELRGNQRACLTVRLTRRTTTGVDGTKHHIVVLGGSALRRRRSRRALHQLHRRRARRPADQAPSDLPPATNRRRPGDLRVDRAPIAAPLAASGRPLERPLIDRPPTVAPQRTVTREQRQRAHVTGQRREVHLRWAHPPSMSGTAAGATNGFRSTNPPPATRPRPSYRRAIPVNPPGPASSRSSSPRRLCPKTGRRRAGRSTRPPWPTVTTSTSLTRSAAGKHHW